MELKNVNGKSKEFSSRAQQLFSLSHTYYRFIKLNVFPLSPSAFHSFYCIVYYLPPHQAFKQVLFTFIILYYLVLFNNDLDFFTLPSISSFIFMYIQMDIITCFRPLVFMLHGTVLSHNAVIVKDF